MQMMFKPGLRTTALVQIHTNPTGDVLVKATSSENLQPDLALLHGIISIQHECELDYVHHINSTCIKTVK